MDLFGADMDKNMQTPPSLHLAVMSGEIAAVDEILHSNSAIVNETDDQGNTPLHIAAKEGDLIIMNMLLSEGADVNTTNNDGNMPLHLAVANRHSRIVELILKKNCNLNTKNKSGYSPLHLAVMSSNYQFVKHMLNKSFDLKRTSQNADVPTCLEATSENQFMVELLLSADADIYTSDLRGFTPLHLAVWYEQVITVGLLLNNAADLNTADIDGDTLLHLAVKKGCLSIAEMLLNNAINKNVDLNITNSFSETPLQLAAEGGHLLIMELLLNNGADVNTINEYCMTTLHTVAESGLLQAVQLLLNRGADSNMLTKFDESPLHSAARKGHTPVVELLLKKGTKVNTANRVGLTPLHLAIYSGNIQTVQLLLNNGADFNKVDMWEDTPLHLAATKGHLSIVELLKDKCTDINKTNQNKHTPLHLAASRGHLNTVKLLLERGADLKMTDDDGETPLHLAISNKHFSTVELLISKSADLNITNENGDSPLHLSGAIGHLPTVELLVNKGADWNIINKNEESPLLLAAKGGHLHTLQLLLSKGSNLHAVNKYGESPLHLAANGGYRDIVKLLLNYNANFNSPNVYGYTPLHFAAGSGDIHTVELLLNKGADISSMTKNNESPLHLASRKGYFPTVELLLQKSVITINKNGNTPLHMAALTEDLLTVKLLINKGIDLNIRNADGNTPLHLAVEYGYVRIVMYLIDKGADINMTNLNGESPLHLAIATEFTPYVEILLKKGANVQITDKNGNTPLHQAVLKENILIIRKLLDYGADVSTKNALGETPLAVAKTYHFQYTDQLIELLQTKESTSDSSIPNEYPTQVSEVFTNYLQMNNHVAITHKDSDSKKRTESEFKYLKKLDSSGAFGQLYETKLLCLVLLRALNDEKIEHFFLGSNIHGIGDMDDICLRYKRKCQQRSTVIFVQAKHRENTENEGLVVEDLLSISGDLSLRKYFESYLTIKSQFQTQSKDPMFEGDFSDVDCYLVIYTPAKAHCFTKKKTKHKINEQVHYIINSGQNTEVFQYDYDKDDIETLTKITILERLKKLGEVFLEMILSEKDKLEVILIDNLIAKYHAAMAKQVLVENKQQQENKNYRLWKFRSEFFESNCEYLTALRSTLFKDLSIKRSNKLKICGEDLKHLELFVESPCASTLSKLIGNLVTCIDKKIQLVEISSFKKNTITKNELQALKERFNNVTITQNDIEAALKEKLLAMEIKLPWSFGNLDMTFRGSEAKVQRRITALVGNLLVLLEDNKDTKIVKIDDNIVGPGKSIERGFVDYNGGIGGAVGNLLIMETDSKMFKLDLKNEKLPFYAALFLNELKNKLKEDRYKLLNENLEIYRFKITLSEFPQYTFHGNGYDQEQARDFLRQLWFYCDQAKQNEVEDIVIRDITKFYNNSRDPKQIKGKMNPHDIFLEAHNEIKDWWMQTGKTPYLNQENNFFQRAKLVCVNNLLSTVVNILNNLKIRNINLKFSAQGNMFSNNFNMRAKNELRNAFEQQSALCCVFDTNINTNDGITEDKNKILKFLLKHVKGEQEHLPDKDLQKNMPYDFAKRTGTSAVRGVMYRTKLLNLVFLRSVTDENIEDFYLGNNVSTIGAMDDICIRYQMRNQLKPVVLFVDAKYKENIDKVKLTVEDLWSTSGDFSLRKYFESCLVIKDRFETDTEDPIFEGDFSDVECYFIISTPVKSSFNKKKTERTLSDQVHHLISSSKRTEVFQYDYNENNIEVLTKITVMKHLKELGAALLELIRSEEKNPEFISFDKQLAKYQMALAREVLKQSEKQHLNNMYRLWEFRSEFFESKCEYLLALKTIIFKELASKCHKNKEFSFNIADREKVDTFLATPCAHTLTKLIGNLVTYNYKTKKLYFVEDKSAGALEINEDIVNEAVLIKLLSFQIKLPMSFGNLDNNATGDTYEEVDLGEGFKYSFKADENDKCQAREFLNKLWFFTSQANVDELEQTLRNEVNKYYDNNFSHNSGEYNNHSLYLRSHDDIEKWSIQTCESPYLRRFSDVFERAELGDIYNLLLSVINFLFVTKTYRVDLNFSRRLTRTSTDDSILDFYRKMTQFCSYMSTSLFKIFNPQFDQYMDVVFKEYFDIDHTVLRLQIQPEVPKVVMKIRMTTRCGISPHYIITNVGPSGGQCLMKGDSLRYKLPFNNVNAGSLRSINSNRTKNELKPKILKQRGQYLISDQLEKTSASNIPLVID